MVDLRPYFLPMLIKDLEEGYADVAPSVFHYIASYLEEGKELPEEVREYLAKALKDIAEGEKPNKALKMNGRKNASKRDRDYEIAKVVYQARQEGVRVEDAFKMDIEGSAYSSETIRAAYYKFKDILKVEYGDDS